MNEKTLHVCRFIAITIAISLSACTQPLGGTTGDPTIQPRVQQSMAPAVGAGTPRVSTPAPEAVKASPVDRIGRTITVGPGADVPTIAQAAAMARNGDTVEVKAGEYPGDVAVWRQKKLTIRAVGGRAVLKAAGKSAEGKGIWVIKNGHFEVEGFDFVGARVPDENGAGIRLEHGTLIVRDARFVDNENGILTSNDGVSTLVIERSLFSGNGHGDGRSHGVYAGSIARVEVRGSWFRNGRVGHLLKTRARENEIEYNRLTDEDGNSSYELEFPNGGRALVIGNIIEQSAKTQNPVIVSYGAEGYKWPVNELVMSHNTVIDSGVKNAMFVRANAGEARVSMVGNLWVGDAALGVAATTRARGNRQVRLSELRDPAHGDYRLSARAASVPNASSPTGQRSSMTASDVPEDWMPRFQYRNERALSPLNGGAALLPGALQH